MASSISSVTAGAKNLPPSGLTKIFETVPCPMLPNMAGDGWGRDVKLKKLNAQEQLQLLSHTRNGVLTNKKQREAGDSSAFQNDDDAATFWESIHLLAMACVDPIFTEEDAIAWMTQDEIDGICCSDVAQFILLHIRSLNEEQPGLEDLTAGLAIVRRMPYALQAIERAYEKGGDALDLLLEGKTPGTQEEMAQFIEKWGGIISHVALHSIRKRAKIEAEVSTEILMGKLVDLICELGYAEKVEGKPDD